MIFKVLETLCSPSDQAIYLKEVGFYLGFQGGRGEKGKEDSKQGTQLEQTHTKETHVERSMEIIAATLPARSLILPTLHSVP